MFSQIYLGAASFFEDCSSLDALPVENLAKPELAPAGLSTERWDPGLRGTPMQLLLGLVPAGILLAHG